MIVWLERTFQGAKPADLNSAEVLNRIPVGTTFEADVVTRKVNTGAWRKRYWVLMQMLADNVAKVELEPGWTYELNKDRHRAHIAMKYLTGFYDSFVLDRGVIVRLLKSTSDEKMEPEEWTEYWPKVLDAVHQHFLQSVDIPTVEAEIARFAS